MQHVAFLLASTVFAPLAGADVLDVPADFPTIQAALDASMDGDEVRVAPGTYFVNALEFSGKAVRLFGDGGALLTELNGGAAGRIASFNDFETPATIIEGFTVTNGVARDGDDFVDGSA